MLASGSAAFFASHSNSGVIGCFRDYHDQDGSLFPTGLTPAHHPRRIRIHASAVWCSARLCGMSTDRVSFILSFVPSCSFDTFHVIQTLGISVPCMSLFPRLK